MMRLTVTLALIGLCVWCTTPAVVAQDIGTFSGGDVILLAHAIAAQAKTTYTISPAYVMPISGQNPAIVTAPVAFEILARALILWKDKNAFPDTITGVTWELHGPPYNEALEPAADRNSLIPALTIDLIKLTPNWLMIASANEKHELPSSLVYEARYKLTAAQCLVAMAMLIDEANVERKIPETIAVPAVRSPKSWENRTAPISLMPMPSTPQKEVDPLSLRVTVNGIEIPKDGAPVPSALNQPFCGPIHIAISANGSVKKVELVIDGVPLRTYDKEGINGLTIDSLQYSDDTHMLSVILTTANDQRAPMVFALRICNGRSSGFTRATATRKNTEEAPAAFVAD
ncbi:MAG TPA: hypothetical protein VGL77_00450 [Armatimonadota bacterium]|jgi:hypothetical protein